MEEKTIILDVTFKAALLARWQSLELSCEGCGLTVRFDLQRLRARTKHRVVSEFVSRTHCRFCGGSPTAAYLVKTFAENDPLRQMSFKVEQWSEDGARLEELVVASRLLIPARAAFDATVKIRPKLHLTLRDRTWLLATTRPDPPPDKVVSLSDRKRTGGEAEQDGQPTALRQ